MVQIAVALIALCGTLAAAILPKWLERRANRKESHPKPTALPTIFVLGAFAVVGAWSAYATSSAADTVAQKTSFFLGIAGIASALFAACASTRAYVFGAYVGYVSTAVAVLFLLWSILFGRPVEAYLWVFALALTVATGRSLLRMWLTSYRASLQSEERP